MLETLDYTKSYKSENILAASQPSVRIAFHTGFASTLASNPILDTILIPTLGTRNTLYFPIFFLSSDSKYCSYNCIHERLHHVVELERCHVVLIWRHNVGVYRITPFTHDNLRHISDYFSYHLQSGVILVRHVVPDHCMVV